MNTMSNKILLEYRSLLYRNLTESVIPFWMKNSLDRDNGGTFSCLDEAGTIYDTKKYIWLVGRSIWTFSRLYNELEKNPAYLEAANLGIDFLENHSKDIYGRYYFSLTKEGKPWFYQRKPYGAVFAMLAYLEYFKATGKKNYKEEAVRLFWKIEEWIQNPTKLDRLKMEGQPAMSNLANVMVLASMAIELAAVEPNSAYTKIMENALRECKNHYHPKFHILMENVPLDEKTNINQWPEGRLFNPGHSIEVSWFILQLTKYIPDKEMEKLALDVLEGSLELGWDKEFEGINYFMDIEGKPTLQLESSMKLWWPHTEAIYALILAYTRTEDPKWLHWLEKVHRYTFGHFVDWEKGGWFGYCDRLGNITHRSKGGNYKGFFHVPRALLFSIQEIDRFMDNKIEKIS